jgi:hypothetical protein
MAKADVSPDVEIVAHLKEFVAYIGQHPDIKPVKKFEAMAGEGTVPPRSQPLGDVFLYPEVLVFLTTRIFGDGMKSALEESLHYTIEGIKEEMVLANWAQHPVSILGDLAKALATPKYQDRGFTEKALTNLHSFFIPLSAIKEIKTGGGFMVGKAKGWREALLPPYITITTHETSYVLSDPLAFGHRQSLFDLQGWRVMYEMTTSKWQTDVVQFLEEKAKANRS